MDSLNSLNSVFSYATERSPFYRERFGRVVLRGAEDMSDLPFTTPDDLRQFGREMLCVSPDEVTRIVTLATSGTTGEAKRVYFTLDDLKSTTAYFEYGVSHIVRRGDRVLNLFPNEREYSVGDMLTKALQNLGCNVVSDVAAAISGEISADFAAGSPDALLKLPNIALRAVLISSEYVDATTRQTLLKTHKNLQIFEHYGLTESGYGFAVTCKPNIDFYHVRERELFVEVIDPVTLKPCPDGVEGEIVFTTLNRQAMPFLRYRTGDRAALLRGVCPLCGSATPRLTRVGARD
jgi:phenylacetate-coenzyme A ligase PaaK-like adenylate-forming protein